MNPRIKAAEERYLREVELLKKAVREEYPSGTYLYATMGGHRLHLCVTGGPSAWSTYAPTTIQVRNVRTGKIRSLCVTLESHDIVLSDPHK